MNGENHISKMLINIDALGFAIALIGADGIIVSANKKFCEMLGYDPTEIIGEHIRTFRGSANDHDDWFGENPCELGLLAECVFIRKSGNMLSVNQMTTQVDSDNPDDVTYCLQLFGVDTLRMKGWTGRSIRSRYEKLFSSIHAGVILVDSRCHIIMCNDVAADTLSIEVDPVTGKCQKNRYWKQCDTSGNVLSVEQYAAMQTLKTGQAMRNVIRGVYLGDPERLYWLLINTEPIMDPDTAQIQEVLITFLDITERKEIENRIRESELQLRSMLDDLPIGLICVDTDANIVYSNKIIRKYTGYTKEEMLELKVWDLDRSYNPERRFDQILESFYGDRLRVFEVVHTRKDGTTYPAEIRVNPMTLDNKPVLAALVQDMTRYKQDEARKLQEERRILQEKNYESLGVLTGGIAHDFNNLLVSILGNADLVLDELPSNSMTRQYVQEIEDASQQAAELCKQMLAYSGRGKTITQPVNLNDVLISMKDYIESTCSERAVVRLELDTDIPCFIADETQIQQIIKNLMANAIESVEGMKNTVSIETGVVTELPDQTWLCDSKEIPNAAKYVYLKVSDSGCGMTPETMSRISEPFFSTKCTGRGLGMSAVVGIVKGHHGYICLKSTPGKGTCVKIFFPMVDDILPVVQPLETASPATTEKKLFTTQLPEYDKMVLLVDDEEMVRRLATRMLKKINYHTIHAESGEIAIDILRQKKFNFKLVLLDLTMPGMSGEKTLEQIRILEPHLPVILSSGFTENVVRSQLGALSPDGFLQKPYLIQSLQNLIESVLNKDHPNGNTITNRTD